MMPPVLSSPFHLDKGRGRIPVRVHFLGRRWLVFYVTLKQGFRVDGHGEARIDRTCADQIVILTLLASTRKSSNGFSRPWSASLPRSRIGESVQARWLGGGGWLELAKVNQER